MEPATSDEFNHAWLGLQWQWQANPLPDWAFPSAASGTLRLVAVRRAEGAFNLWDEPNVLTQKLPAPEFVATTKVTFTPRFPGEETGLVLLGQSYAYIGVKKTETGLVVRAVERNHADRGGDARESASRPTAASTLYLRLTVRPGAIADFSYSEDGREFHPLLQGFKAEQGRWIGATMGIFAMGTSNAGESGYADFDWFRVQNPADLSPVFRGAIQ
jgi:beta-xylosidase